MGLPVPSKYQLIWAANALNAYVRSIPTQSQIGIQNGAASLNDGFPPLNFTPETAGGTPPFGQDFNGIFRLITQIQQYQQAGGAWTYDSDFATAINGYPINAIVASAVVPGRFWLNTIDGNMQNPDMYPFTGWVTPPGMSPPGTPIPSFQAAVLPGCVIANGLTIGNTGSGGSTPPTALASLQAFFLYCAIWLQFPQTICPVQFNGVAVSRSANPLLDWQAGRVIVLPWMAGAGVIGQDNMGTRASSLLNGAPLVTGSLLLPGSIVGENTHTLHNEEVPNLAVSVSGSCSVSVGVSSNRDDVLVGETATSTGGGPFEVLQNTSYIQLQSNGSGSGSVTATGATTTGEGGAHNNVQRNFTVAWNLSL